MKYASLDLETTGLDNTYCQILEVGVVIDDLDQPLDPNPPTFHAYLRHRKIVGEPYALNMNAHIIKIIAENKHPDLIHPEELELQLERFLGKHIGTDNGKYTFAGKNFQGFDKPFLQANGIKLPFHHRCFDATTSFYKKGDKQLPDLALCLKRAGKDGIFQLHTAVDDAKAVIQLLRHVHPHGLDYTQ